MKTAPLDFAQANALADEYGALMGGRVEYRYYPAEAPYGEEFGIRLYLPDGRTHGVRMKFWNDDDRRLPELFAEAKDAWTDRLSEAA